MASRSGKFSWSKFSTPSLGALLDVIGGDGHTIYTDKWLLEEGVDPSIIEAFSHKYTSDGSLKGSIEVGGRFVDSMVGVYGLTVLRSLGSYFSVESDMLGRGSEARDLTEKIRAKLGGE